MSLNDRQTQEKRNLNPSKDKPLGKYLIDAGLLNEAQVSVALADQQLTGMRFGEIVVARGWMKEQTVEYLMEKVVVPERQLKTPQIKPNQPNSGSRVANLAEKRAAPSERRELREPAREPQSAPPSSMVSPAQQAAKRKDLPISKPLPSVNSVDSDVSWVG